MVEQKEFSVSGKNNANISRGNVKELRKDYFIDILHIFVLFAFAFTQPLFELLSRNIEFFVARQSEPVDIFSFILILCVLLPLPVVVIEVIAGLFGQRVRKSIHGFMVAILLAIIALAVLKKLLDLPGITLIAGAAILGITGSVVYLRFRPVRMFFTCLSPALLIFPCIFLWNSSVSKVLFPEKDPSSFSINIDNPPSLIMIIFDEFPVISLMNEKCKIDPVLYPNFAALSQDAYWFRNATSVGGSTLQIVPGILSGLYPDKSRMPTAADYPDNVFTLLGGSYDMKIFETHTMLCPETLCGNKKRHQPLAQRMCSMLSDLSAVYLHMVLPSDLTSGLPIVTQNWKHFWGDNKGNKNDVSDDEGLAHKHKDRALLFAEFVESITISDKPTFYFLHIVLPHVPWEYLPSGKRYTKVGIPGLNIKKELWGDNEWLVIQGYQRHLLQVGFVDKLVGDLLDRLKVLNLYDRSLIVITADHGVNFWPNKSRRCPLWKIDPMCSLGVPLFIKTPTQHEGIISDHNVKTIDILPTIADILDIRLLGPVDGHSALNSSLLGETGLAAKYETLERKFSLFGSGSKPDGLFKIGPNHELTKLVGQHISNFNVINNDSIVINIQESLAYNFVDSKAMFVPTCIRGDIYSNKSINMPFNLAVAINGVIQAVTQSFDSEGKTAKFIAMVPESSLKGGKNDVEVFIAYNNSNGQFDLIHGKDQNQISYSLSLSDKILIRNSDSLYVKIIQGALSGSLDLAVSRDGHVLFAGWAADIKKSRLPDAIVAFINGEFFFSGKTGVNRPDVAKYYNDPDLQKAGFEFVVPFSIFKDKDNPEVRFFAIKGGVASELYYPKGYKWGKKS